MKMLPQVLVNVKVTPEMKSIHEKDDQIIARIKEMEDSLHGKGRVLIRPSGTEPLLRIMLEGENQVEIDYLAHSLANLILEKVKVNS